MSWAVIFDSAVPDSSLLAISPESELIAFATALFCIAFSDSSFNIESTSGISFLSFCENSSSVPVYQPSFAYS